MPACVGSWVFTECDERCCETVEIACPAQDVTRFRSFGRLGAKIPLGEGCVDTTVSHQTIDVLFSVPMVDM